MNEQLVQVLAGDVALFQQGLGDMRPPDGTACRQFLNPRPFDFLAEAAQFFYHAPGTFDTRIAHLLQFFLERGVRVVDEITQYVNLAVFHVGTDFNTGYHAQCWKCSSRFERRGYSVYRVMVG